MPGSAGKYDLPKTPRADARQQEIDEANTVPVQVVLQELYQMHVPSDLSRSWKTHCPLGFEHPDGGIERTMRVYQTNTAYCFSTHGFLSPVRLAMHHWDKPALYSARRLNKMFSEKKQREPYWERMARLVEERETKSTLGSAQQAFQALQESMSSDTRYTERQFDEDVTSLMEHLLEELDTAINERRRGAVRDWFTHARREMTRLLDATQHV